MRPTTLSEHQARRYLRRHAFRAGVPGRIGLELEWIVIDPRRPDRRWKPAATVALPARMPAGGSITYEPGGQLELSTAAAGSLAECVHAAHADISLLRGILGASGLRMIGTGLDSRPPMRVVELSRYAALEHSYAKFGSAGHTMMCNAASIQVNVEAGRGPRRWRVLNILGPLLTAIFANSPQVGNGTGRSARQMLRFQTDPSRTDPVRLDGDHRTVWAEYALSASVVGADDMTMRSWLTAGTVRLTDLRTHLLTVIPPIRPRGFLELRMIDAQCGDDWVVPATVVAAAVDDRPTAEVAYALAQTLPVPDRREHWITAARDGLADPVLADAARSLMSATVASLPRLNLPTWADSAVRAYAERYTQQARCPADDEVADACV